MLKHLFFHIKEVIEAIVSRWEIWFVLLILGVLGTRFFGPQLEWLEALIQFLKATWWFWFFFPIFWLAHDLWLFWRQELFKEDIAFEIREMVIPRLHERTPKSMEQVLRAIHSLTNAAGNPQERYWDGEVTRWYSFEIASFAGELHFYVRYYKKQRELIEAAFFAHYPDVELIDVPDYMEHLPKSMKEIYAEGRDLWGTELKLTREEAYPIVSYKGFTDEVEEERRVDPVASIIEVLSKCTSGQFAGVQINIAGIGDSWRKEWEPLVEELKAKSSRKAISEEGESGITTRTPGETDAIRAVEDNLSKPAFNVIIRYIYISPLETYYDSFPRRGLRGAFQQYNSLGLNGFADNTKASTKTDIWSSPYLFPKQRVEGRKRRILYNFLHREMPPESRFGRFLTSHYMSMNFGSKTIKLNVESLATIFHPPTAVVLTGPHMPRRESRRTGPPSGLPIFGEEGEIEKFK